ncbi:MAG: caspase family protein [Xenococcus sp. MO_188.B8]|nr:caspase family protein [Xenococcus sp. MO_188.B8]
MVKNWAITIGINQYYNLQRLRYAMQDAKAVRNYLHDELDFQNVYYFSDDSLPIQQDYGPPLNSSPTYATLRRFLRLRFEKSFLSDGDSLWFFFTGHGLRYQGIDYLMLLDSDPGDVELTAIPITYVIERLRRSGADNILLFIDACRFEGSRQGYGIGVEVYQGVTIFYANSPNQQSFEIEELRHSSFTYALLEGLQIRGARNLATITKLAQYLKSRVPELNQQHRKTLQNPYASVEPVLRSNLIILPEQATLSDILTLKNDAVKAESQSELKLAKQLWIRVLQVYPADAEAIEAMQRLERRSSTEDSMEPRVSSITSATQNKLDTEAFTPSRRFSTKSEGLTRVLIVAGNPRELSQLRFDEEFRNILEGLRLSQQRDQFIIETSWAVRAADLRRAMLDVNPQIVHFIGSETEQGLVFEDATGEIRFVEIELLANLFALFSNQLECVLLTGCYSDAQAQAISRNIDYVIGLKQEIGDKATIDFSVSFYSAIGAGRSFEFAYQFGCNSIQMAGISKTSLPVLLKRTKKPVASDVSLEVFKRFLEQIGADIHFSGNRILEILSTPNQLEAYIPFPALLVKNKPTKQDINDLVDNSARLANNRPKYVGILIYQQRPDPLALMWIAEARLLYNCLIIPIPFAEIEKVLSDKDKCKAVLAEYVDRYVQRADFFDDRNAISDTLSFFGRVDLLNKLEQELLRCQGIGLFGIRKSGKTSILFQLGFLLRKNPIVHIDLQQYGGSFYGADLFNTILQQLFLLVRERLPYRRTNVRRLTSGTPAKELTNDFVKQFSALTEPLELAEYKLPVVCFIDEVERILPTPHDPKERVEEFNAFFGAMRVLSQQNRNLALLVADVHPDCNRINNWEQKGVATNPVFSFFKEIFLSPFSEQETIEMLTGLGNLMGLEFDQDIPTEIHKESGGHPYIARQLARFLILKLPRDSQGIFQWSSEKEVWENLLFEHDELSNYFKQSVWEDLKKHSFESAMNILKIISANETENRKLDESSLLLKLSGTCSKYDFQIAIKWLLKVGLIDRKAENEHIFCTGKVTHFLRWLQMNMSEEESNKWQVK